MNLAEEFAKTVKVKVTKGENDARVLLMGEPVQYDKSGKEFFIIPACFAQYIRETCPGWTVGDEFVPDMGEKK